MFDDLQNGQNVFPFYSGELPEKLIDILTRLQKLKQVRDGNTRARKAGSTVHDQGIGSNGVHELMVQEIAINRQMDPQPGQCKPALEGGRGG